MNSKTRIILILLLLVQWSVPVSSYGQAAAAVQSFTRMDPLYPAPPFQYRNNRIVTVIFNTTPETLQRLVPKPMMPMPSAPMFMYFGRLNVIYGPVTFSYLEAGICIPVMVAGKPGYYPTVLFLDKTLAIPPGREIYGFPKKDAVMRFERSGDTIHLSVNRFDEDIIMGTVTLKEAVEPDTTTPELPWFNLKIIPSVVKGAPPDVKQITSVVNKESRTTVMRNAEASLIFKSTGFDRLGEIPILNIVAARYSEGDFVLDYGEVIYDYLEKK